MDLVQRCDEELVGVLLCVPSQLRRRPPRGSQKRDRAIGHRFTRIYLREEIVQFAASTVGVLARCTVVFAAKEVAAEEGVVNEGLEDDIEETRLAKVQESATTFTWNRDSVFEGRSILFILNPGMVGLTALLYDYHGSDALRRND